LGRETRFGFQFARARVQLIDYEEMGDFEAILWMDALSIEKPAMPREAMKTLFFELEKDYLHEQNKRKRYELIMKDPYMNALQVKFAYAITCHKSQGGQWATVFLDHGYLTDEMLDTSFFRWLYTGFTRASFRLYLLNFDAHFFPAEEE
jgi:exodeoxyribonuclease-5